MRSCSRRTRWPTGRAVADPGTGGLSVSSHQDIHASSLLLLLVLLSVLLLKSALLLRAHDDTHS